MSDNKNEAKVVTPEDTEAEYVYTDFVGNPVYFDGSDYWVKEKGEILYYG